MMVWLQLTSGRGPDECCWVVDRLFHHICDEAASRSIAIRVLETVRGTRKHTLKSALIALEGIGAEAFAAEWDGTVLWVGQSMFRRGHKRKNWFAGVNVLKPPETRKIDTGMIKVETMRSSGPGGQHVNTTESAVRVTHIPSGVSVTAREERSQHMNKKLAMVRLFTLLEQKESNQEKQAIRSRWGNHNDLERGNPVKVFTGIHFREKR